MVEEWQKEIERENQRLREQRVKRLRDIQQKDAEHLATLGKNFDWTAESLVPRDPNVPDRFYFDRSKIK